VRNLEYKARVDDLKPAIARARALGADLWGDLRQTDTYFEVPSGRLKLRETAGFQAELIYYQREEQGETRPSDYQIAHSTEPDAMRALLSAALGVRTVVRKRRTLLLLDVTRIHLNCSKLAACSTTALHSRPRGHRLAVGVACVLQA
jgi:adenylate cyclase class IV